MKEAVKLMKNTQRTHPNVQEGMKVVRSTHGEADLQIKCSVCVCVYEV